jgi:phosphatidylglycerol:prolipoprotein diacylglycerol transferase
MFPFFRLGPFLVQIPELTVLLGIIFGSRFAEKEAREKKINPDLISNLIYFGLIAAIVGARLEYALRYLPIYLADPLALLALNLNTLQFSDGIMVGMLVAVIYGFRQKLPLRETLDTLTPGLAIFMIFLGISHLFSGAAYGAPANILWAINLWGANRHPTQIYEILSAAAIFTALRLHVFGKLAKGLNFAIYLALAATGSMLLETFRGDSLILASGFRTAQVVSLLTLLISFWLFTIWGGLKKSVSKQLGNNK